MLESGEALEEFIIFKTDHSGQEKFELIVLLQIFSEFYRIWKKMLSHDLGVCKRGTSWRLFACDIFFCILFLLAFFYILYLAEDDTLPLKV
jgi:hypothetical protein